MSIKITATELTALRQYIQKGQPSRQSARRKQATQGPLAKVKSIFAKVKKGVQSIGKPVSLRSRIAKYDYMRVKGARSAIEMLQKAYNNAHEASGARKTTSKAQAFFKEYVYLPQCIKTAVKPGP